MTKASKTSPAPHDRFECVRESIQSSREPTYSIIVATFNRASYLDTCLQSLASQVVGASYEVVVIDDGSSDMTWHIATEYARRYPAIFRLVRQRHKGLAAAKNLGITSSTGRIIVFLDDDTLVPPDFLRKIDSTLHDGNVDVLGFIDLPRTDDSYLGKSKRYLENFSRCFLIKDLRRRLKGNLAIRRSVLDYVGLFDESRTFYKAEDTELNYRIAGTGAHMMFANNVYVYHRSGSLMEFIGGSFSILTSPSMLDVPDSGWYYRVHLGLVLLLCLILIPISKLNGGLLLGLFFVALSALVTFSFVASALASGSPKYGPGIVIVAAARLLFILLYSIRFLVEQTRKVLSTALALLPRALSGNASKRPIV